jgi:hypothetical protein
MRAVPFNRHREQDVSNSIDALRIARAQVKEAFKGIGEPLVRLPLDQLSVHTNRDGETVITIRADHFIKLAETYAGTTPALLPQDGKVE